MWGNLDFFKSGKDIEVLSKLKEPYLPDYRYIYRALKTPMEAVRAVIVGQDPYPTPGYATGLAFSIPPNKRPIPPSLRNIFKEYCDDLHHRPPSSGDLSLWASRGVLLLNTVLTVAPYAPGSHKDLGWQELTNEVLRRLAERGKCVFIMWGKEAQQSLPDLLPAEGSKRNRFILSAHPSPLSAHRGFLGSRPFSKCNAFLRELKQEPIDWRLP